MVDLRIIQEKRGKRRWWLGYFSSAPVLQMVSFFSEWFCYQVGEVRNFHLL